MRSLLWAGAVGAAAGGGITAALWGASWFGAAGWIAAGALLSILGAALAVAGARLYRLSITDELTRLYNRRHFYRRLSREMAAGRPALVLVDVDDFRQYNTLYGHAGGDAVLRAISSVLRTEVRKGDLVARWGGEEFVVMLPGASLDEALVVAERLRRTVAESKVDVGGRLVEATISAGVTVAPPFGGSLPEVINQADRAMYAAKRLKNRVLPAG